jgi:hypothetical protein
MGLKFKYFILNNSTERFSECEMPKMRNEQNTGNKQAIDSRQKSKNSDL